RHDRPGAVRDEYVVGYPDRDLLAVDGVDRESPGCNAGLLALSRHALDLGLLARARDVLANASPVLLRRDLLHERVLRRQDHERRSEQRVRSRRVDAYRLALVAGHREIDLGPLTAPNPVGLHD